MRPHGPASPKIIPTRRHMSKFALLAIIAGLCFGWPTVNAADDRAVAASIDAANPANIAKRWGDLGKIMGQTFFDPAGIGTKFSWIVPGYKARQEALDAKGLSLGIVLIRYDPVKNVLIGYSEGAANLVHIYIARVQPDGSVAMEGHVLKGTTFRLLGPTQLLYRDDSTEQLLTSDHSSPGALSRPSAVVAASPPANFRWLQKYFGKKLINLNEQLTMTTQDNGNVLNFNNFQIRPTANPRVFSVVDIQKVCEKSAFTFEPDNTFVFHCDKPDHHFRYIYSEQKELFHVTVYWKDPSGGDWEHVNSSLYQFDTPETRATELARYQRNIDERERLLAMYREANRREMEEAERENNERRSAAFANALGELSDYANREAKKNSDQQAMLANINARAEAQMQTQRDAAAARARVASERSAQQLADNARLAAARSQAAAQERQTAQSQQMARNTEPVAQQHSAARTGSGDSSSSSETPRQSFWEAVMVCTNPTGPNGNFVCSSPLNRQSGHLKDVSGARTPQEMVDNSREACPDARRLVSSAHLVWGCGFAATNNSNSLDRSAGIDITGRALFFCYPKEIGCRRTTR